jgi:hypothetical protein
VLLVLESTPTCYHYVCVSPAIEQVLTHLRCDCRLTTTPQLLTGDKSLVGSYSAHVASHKHRFGLEYSGVLLNRDQSKEKSRNIAVKSAAAAQFEIVPSITINIHQDWS